MATVAEFLRQLSKAPGPIWVPVLGAEDAWHVRIIRADLIAAMRNLPPDGAAPFALHWDIADNSWTLTHG